MNVTPEYKINLAHAMRQRATPSEARLWQAIRDHKVANLGFRRQRPVGRYVADFCCVTRRLIVEVDGDYHLAPEQQELDRERAAHFTGRGYVVLRVTADEVMRDLPGILEKIRRAGVAPTPCPSPVPGEGSLLRQHLPPEEAERDYKTPLSRNGGGAGGGGTPRNERKAGNEASPSQEGHPH